MEHRLLCISKALAQSAIDAHNHHATYLYLNAGVTGDTARAVYNELVVGAKAKSSARKLAKNITRVALLAYWRSIRVIGRNQSKVHESGGSFIRAHLAVHSTLKKMIRETNFQRKLHSF